jgi:hypothetical protein
MPTRVPAGHPAFDLATPLPRCRACVRRSAPRGDRATCGSGTGAPDRPGRSTSGCRLEARLRHPRDAIFKPRGPGRHRRTPRPRVTRAGARATARSAEVMRDTAGAVSRAPMSVGIPMPTRVPGPGHPGPGVRPRDTAPAVSRMCPALRATGRQGHLRLGHRGPRPARSVDIRLPTRGATSAPARCDRQTPGPRQAPPNAPSARHASRCAGHGAERRGHA